MADRLLDVRAAAAMLGVKTSTLYAWAYERRIACVRLGRLLRFRESALVKFIERNETPARRAGNGD